MPQRDFVCADLLGNPLPATLINAQSMDEVKIAWRRWLSMRVKIIDEYNRIPTRTQSALLTTMADNYAELYEDWVDETGVRIVAVSIDDMRSMNRVAPYVNSVGWEYDILLDPNRDFARALNVNNVPHPFVVDAEGNVVWSHNNYADGDEYELYEELLKFSE